MTKARGLIGDTNFGKGRFIDALSRGIQHDLTPGQKVTALNVPLTSFGNDSIDDLYRDLFWSIYLYESRLKEVPTEGREEVRAMLDWVLADPTFKAKSMLFVNRKLTCATASYKMTEELLRAPRAQEAMNQLGQAERMEQEAEQLEGEADKAESGQSDDQSDEQDNDQEGNGSSGSDEQDEEGNDGQGSGGGDDESYPDIDDQERQSPDELRDQAEELRKQAQQIRQKAQQNIEELTGSQMSKFGRAGAIGQGVEMGEKVGQFLRMWGVDEGDGMMMSYDQIKLVMDGLSSTGVGALTALIGRVHGIASATMRGRFPAQIHVDQAGYTKSIMDMHPAERFKLTDFYPARQQAIEDWMKHGLGGVTKTTQAAREGSFICMVDESGSMEHEEQGGSREVIAKALALGLARAARENGQEFVLGGFGSQGELTDLIDSRTELNKLLEWATFFFNGGTSFDFALTTMMDIVDGLIEEDKYKSDLLLITDGECSIREEVANRLYDMKQAYGVRLFSLVIGSTGGAALQDVADEMLEFSGVDEVAAKLSGLIWQ
jgi:hypothetical protein